MPAIPGYYGKMPSRGDFLRGGLSGGFVAAWDAWLQAAMAASRQSLGAAWQDLYLQAPLWRFALADGAAAGPAAAGVLMPSVDGVGRHFPLTVAAELADDPALGDIFGGWGPWFDAVEDAALACLDFDFDPAALPARLPPAPPAGRWAAVAAWPVGGGEAFLLPPDGAGATLAPLAEARLRSGRARTTLWWTLGSDAVEPVLLVADGMPDAAMFVAMLGGAAPDAGVPVGAVPDGGALPGATREAGD